MNAPAIRSAQRDEARPATSLLSGLPPLLAATEQLATQGAPRLGQLVIAPEADSPAHHAHYADECSRDGDQREDQQKIDGHSLQRPAAQLRFTSRARGQHLPVDDERRSNREALRASRRLSTEWIVIPVVIAVVILVVVLLEFIL